MVLLFAINTPNVSLESPAWTIISSNYLLKFFATELRETRSTELSANYLRQFEMLVCACGNQATALFCIPELQSLIFVTYWLSRYIMHDSKWILDIDECVATNATICDETNECINSLGGYQCVCLSGFAAVDNNGTQVCEGEFNHVRTYFL